jgi:hypothetical protein
MQAIWSAIPFLLDSLHTQTKNHQRMGSMASFLALHYTTIGMASKNTPTVNKTLPENARQDVIIALITLWFCAGRGGHQCLQ